MKIIDYIIVQETGYSATQNVVYELIQKGWQPLGGVSISGSQTSQAMVKYDTVQVETLFSQVNDIHTTAVIDIPNWITEWREHMSYPRNVSIQK